MNVSEAVVTRRSVRSFLDKAVPFETLERVLDQARWAPSGCNFQPWEAVVLTGRPLRDLQERILSAERDNPQEYDFFGPSQDPKYHERRVASGAALYGSLGIGREDDDARAEFIKFNVLSFGAPVLLLCHFPKMMQSAQWADVGIWLQTIMLLLRAEGLDTCPQEFLGLYGRTIKAYLGLSEDELLFCGLAIGWRDPKAAVNNFKRGRLELADQIAFHGFE